MPSYQLNQILSFDQQDGHPDSKIVGVDSYTFDARDGLVREWLSYTLVPVNSDDAKGVYERWYVVDFPDIGLNFVEIIQESDLPEGLTINEKLTGKASIVTNGDGEMGTGQAVLETFDTPEGYMVARETFAQDDSVMYFRNSALKGPVAVIG